MIRDQQDDINKSELVAMASLYTIPDYVKVASDEELYYKPVELPETCFADPFNRRYPCHTKAATVVSHLFFQEHPPTDLDRLEYDRIRSRLMKEAMFWNVVHDVENLQTSKQASVKLAGDSGQRVILTRADGSQQDEYLLEDYQHITKAASWMQKNDQQLRHRYEYPERRKLAASILYQGQAKGVDFSDLQREYLQRVAGFAIGDTVKAASMLRRRVQLAEINRRPLSNEESMSALKLANYLERNPQTGSQFELLQGVVTTLDAMDRRQENMQYTEFYPEPESIYHHTRDKLASIKDHFRLTTGGVFKIADLMRLDPDQAVNALGTAVFEALSTGGLFDESKIAEAAHTLPLPNAEILEDLLQNSGGVKVASLPINSVGFSKTQLQEIMVR